MNFAFPYDPADSDALAPIDGYNRKNVPVNLDHVESIYPDVTESIQEHSFHIVFVVHGGGKSYTWTYAYEESRDEAYAILVDQLTN